MLHVGIGGKFWSLLFPCSNSDANCSAEGAVLRVLNLVCYTGSECFFSVYPKYPNFPGTHPDSPWGYPQTHPDVLQRFRSDPKSRFLVTKRVNVVCTEACPIVCTRTFLTVGPGVHPWTLHLSLTHQPIPARDRIIQRWTTICGGIFFQKAYELGF